MKLSELIDYIKALSPELQDAELTDELTESFVLFLKKQVDHFRFIDVSISVKIANQIISIGISEGNLVHQALGHMAKGDSLSRQGKVNEAWDELKLAEALYLQAEDDVGWARTRIGLIYVANRKGKVYRDIILQDLERAHRILTENGFIDKSIVLSINTAISYKSTGDYGKALETYEKALKQLETQEEEAQRLYTGMIYENMAVVYDYIINNQKALDLRQIAQEHFAENQQREALLRSQINSSFVLRHLGHYAQAIRLIRSAMETEWYPDHKLGERLLAEKALLNCYLDVGKYRQAIKIANKTRDLCETLGNQLTLLEILTYQAIAQAELRRYEAALDTLAYAQEIGQNLDAEYWIAENYRLRSKIFINQQKVALALNEVQKAWGLLQPSKNQFVICSLNLIEARCYVELKQYTKARRSIESALEIAEQQRILSIQYDAHLLQAQIHDKLAEHDSAIEEYETAASFVNYTLQTLSLTLRTDYLAQNGQAHQQLALYHLQNDNAANALQAIEKIKANLHLTYSIQHEQLHWQKDEITKAQWKKLDRLREAYHEQDIAASENRNPEILAKLAEQIESLREHLYLSTGQNEHAWSQLPTLIEIQARLAESEIIITYYETPDKFYAILISQTQSACIPLGDTNYCKRLISQCYINFNAVLRSSLRNINIKSYTKMAQIILQRLYDVLVKPFQTWLDNAQKLWIVPYGDLHQVPFGCLCHNGHYLIQEKEIALLPYTGQITLHNQANLSDDVTILSHSFNQQVPMRLTEGEMVAHHFDTGLYAEEAARRELVYGARGKLLHIAAHAQFYLDHPDLSYIQLGDGKLYVDELFQQQMPIEFVILSACETGQARVAPGDELLGLGRGFLYSGVQALLVSLWRVADTYTYRLMTAFYDTLLGIDAPSKSRALQQAKCTLLEEEPALHPALWGAFQCIGDSRPITSC